MFTAEPRLVTIAECIWDSCTDQFNQNQLQTVKKGREKLDLIARSDDLEISIKTLTDVIQRSQDGDCRDPGPTPTYW